MFSSWLSQSRSQRGFVLSPSEILQFKQWNGLSLFLLGYADFFAVLGLHFSPVFRLLELAATKEMSFSNQGCWLPRIS